MQLADLFGLMSLAGQKIKGEIAMSVHELKLQSREENPMATETKGKVFGQRCRAFIPRWLPITLVAMVVLMLHALPAHAQEFVPCPDEQQPLATVPELAAKDGKLRGTIVLSDEQESIPFRQPPNTLPGAPGTTTRCQTPYVRILRGVNATPAPSPGKAGTYPNPMPGPTLRARVGDLIQLTFINEINAKHFGRSIDNGETGVGCDQTPGIYPKSAGAINDTYPDCFHGSSTGNIHFHGTHTNPNSTGDNVFIEVRPLPRDNQGKLTTSPEKVQRSLDDFFAKCEKQLSGNVLLEWPKLWSDLPSDWTDLQKDLLQDYDKELAKLYGVPPAKQLWPVNAGQLRLAQWPQYYVGAFPYCYRLPAYTAKTWSPPGQSPMQMSGMGTHTGGAGMSELRSKGADPAEQGEVNPSLIMGQSPGTHWYHAHKHGSTAINVANGMTGAFIIEGPYDDDLNYFYGTDWTKSQPVMVINQLGVSPNLERGAAGRTDKGPDFSVNGQIKPVIQMRPGEVQMWRIVNTSGRAGTFFAAPHKDSNGKPDQYEWRQIAQDGVQFNDANYKTHHNKSFLLAAGNRADLLVKALPCAKDAKTCMYPVIVQNEVDPSDLTQTIKVPLVSISVAGDAVDPASPRANFIPDDKFPTFPPFLADISSDEIKDNERVMRFSSTGPGKGGVHKIDGKQFDGEVGALVKLNTVEQWKVINETYGPLISHPFHIHINPFQIVEVFDPNEILTDKNGKPVIDPISKKPANKYIFQGGVRRLPGQCYLDPFADPNTWKPCGPPPVNKNGIWWDVFPIPSGTVVTTSKLTINPTTGKPAIDPKTGKTVPVKVNVPGYFKMRSRFVDYAGFYVLHCHILAHEDRGMMTVVEVAPARPPYSHN
jgi:FtsP/CotA-like multicopper oxidase with cupredoxin domain